MIPALAFFFKGARAIEKRSFFKVLFSSHEVLDLFLDVFLFEVSLSEGSEKLKTKHFNLQA